eukprot:gnl/MRDRNA2_/MRDRNA2_352675_c0_seq1.p1 gnl/MRDRNA2_/MRDRNA2_352675_c0~~gnl/MRDRNA2_/MRDRNA2_352675_c0_seq1.p1  ORF type:complete len:224 (-),score=14.88 gnl/MRDRNA2_/MRDRNA2_352675_c0_seq1:130-732(-)
MAHQLGTHGVCGLLIAVRLYTDGTSVTEWLSATWDMYASGLLERHVQYSCIGCMFKDVFFYEWVRKASAMTIGGFFVHHAVTVIGCLMWLQAPSGAGIGTAIALDAEISSGFYCLFKLYPRPWSAALYAVTQPASLLLGIWGTAVFVAWPVNAKWSSLCQVLCFLLVAVRLGGLVLEREELKRLLFSGAQHPSHRSKKSQ